MRTLLTGLAAFLLLAGFLPPAQSQTVLDRYIAQALKDNQVLQQKQLSLDHALLSLRIARGMFMPNVSVQGAYTSGDGGRTISVPVGDLMNPVYTALNQLTESNAFPQIENVNENFFPNNFYDVKLHTTMPIFNTGLVYHHKVKQQQVVMQEFELAIYRRELIKEIKSAYFSYRSATEVIAIYEAALERAKEGKRVNESLLANGKGLPAYVMRAQSEVEGIQAQLTASQKQADYAKMYFNFLLNRDRDAAIEADPAQEIPDLEAALGLSGQREELMQLQQAASINETVLRMNRSHGYPRLSGFLDLGSQYQDWEFNSRSRYYLFGFQLEVPLFAGFTNRHRVRQAELDLKNTQLGHALLVRQVSMAEQRARNDLIVAYENHQSAKTQLAAAASYQRLIEKGYREGVNSFIETVDARSQLTAAQLQVNITRFRTLIALAQLERETGAFSFQ